MTPTASPITDVSQLDANGSYTYADYLSWKFEEMVELVRGKVLRKMAGPATMHQQVSSSLQGEPYQYLKRKACQIFAAPFGVRLLRSTGSSDAQVRTVVQPDLCVVCDPAKLDARGCLGAPDWIIEIVSPGSVVLDTRTKFDLYAENGVTEYWLVFPLERAVLTFALQNDEYQPTGTYEEPGLVPSRTLPELALQWADVFERVS
ncbi:MAG: Uma2 family endonuclease [Hymenobacter sp.]|nr:MAG: Uma2 family endonuclease [Hymenobacter sp.]